MKSRHVHVQAVFPEGEFCSFPDDTLFFAELTGADRPPPVFTPDGLSLPPPPPLPLLPSLPLPLADCPAPPPLAPLPPGLLLRG